MFQNRYFLPSFLILAVIAFLHWIASDNGYYDIFGWYDFMMHFLGGVWVALFTLWVAYTQYGARLRPFVSSRNLFVLICLIGIAWEIFELVLHITDYTVPGYAWDTIHDLIMDVLGTSAVLLYARGKRS